MKRLLLITGDIAAGKTTFSNQLAQRYSVAVFQRTPSRKFWAITSAFATGKKTRNSPMLLCS